MEAKMEKLQTDFDMLLYNWEMTRKQKEDEKAFWQQLHGDMMGIKMSGMPPQKGLLNKIPKNIFCQHFKQAPPSHPWGWRLGHYPTQVLLFTLPFPRIAQMLTPPRSGNGLKKSMKPS